MCTSVSLVFVQTSHFCFHVYIRLSTVCADIPRLLSCGCACLTSLCRHHTVIFIHMYMSQAFVSCHYPLCGHMFQSFYRDMLVVNIHISAYHTDTWVWHHLVPTLTCINTSVWHHLVPILTCINTNPNPSVWHHLVPILTCINISVWHHLVPILTCINISVWPHLVPTLTCINTSVWHLVPILTCINISVWHHFEGFRPEWCISTIYHAWDTPFWLGTLDLVPILTCINTSVWHHLVPTLTCINTSVWHHLIPILTCINTSVWHHLVPILTCINTSVWHHLIPTLTAHMHVLKSWSVMNVVILSLSSVTVSPVITLTADLWWMWSYCLCQVSQCHLSLH